MKIPYQMFACSTVVDVLLDTCMDSAAAFLTYEAAAALSSRSGDIAEMTADLPPNCARRQWSASEWMLRWMTRCSEKKEATAEAEPDHDQAPLSLPCLHA